MLRKRELSVTETSDSQLLPNWPFRAVCSILDSDLSPTKDKDELLDDLILIV